MKNLLLIITLPLLILTETYSQSCLPDGISFTTQAQIDSFQINYPNCSEIEGNVQINGSNIVNLSGLLNLTSIGGNLLIGSENGGNQNLSSLVGLDSIVSLGGTLSVVQNSSLTNLVGLNNLSTIDGGAIMIRGNSILENLVGLENLTSVVGLDINFNWALMNLSGLEGLTSLTYLSLFHNPLLTSLSGLNNVTQLSSVIWIDENYDLLTLEGLNNIESIGDELSITGNSSLENIEALSNLTSINGPLVVYYNNSLTSLEGLDNINPQSINHLYIVNNPALETCNVESVCEYVANPYGAIDILNNNDGCNSIEEVEEECLVILNEILPKNEIMIYPNPTVNCFFIESSSNCIIENVYLHNTSGQEIISNEGNNRKIDISRLRSGCYFVTVKANGIMHRKKLIKE